MTPPTPAGSHAAALAMAAAAACALATPALAASRSVAFAASDGTQLSGTFYEGAPRPAPAVVLVHMLGRSKEDWHGFAQRLEDAGFLVLAFDLRGHGRSSGSPASLAAMVSDLAGAVDWTSARPGVRAIAIVGASLGATLGVLAAADLAAVRALALVSPSLDYRGLRLDAAALKKMGDRAIWMAASAQDPYALRTLRELAGGDGAREQRVSNAAAHGTNLLAADADLARALLDWLRRTLIS